jgi:hypothetical protein
VLGPFRQALLVLRWFVDATRVAQKAVAQHGSRAGHHDWRSPDRAGYRRPRSRIPAPASACQRRDGDSIWPVATRAPTRKPRRVSELCLRVIRE